MDERPSCSERVDQSKPSGKLASQVPLPSSRIVLTASVDKPQLLREIASHIPETLATEKRRPIGTPGEVSYTVTRGSVDSSIADGAFHVTTLANASIEICKPLGPFCVTYGRCQPVLATTVSLPFFLDEDFGWPDLTASVRAERGCSIMGFDVTPRLTSIARDNLGGVRQRIEQSLPPVKPWASRLWDLVHTPIFLDKDHCLRGEPKRFVQSPPQETPSGYALRLGLELELELSRECREERAKLPLAPLATEPSLPNPSPLSLTQTISSAAIEAQLRQQVPKRFGKGERIKSIAVSSWQRGDENRLLLGVELDGVTCGTVWLSAAVEGGPDQSVRLKRVRFTQGSTPATLQHLPKHLAHHATIRPSLPFAAAIERMKQLLEIVTTVPVERVRVAVELQGPSAVHPVVTETGIQAVAEAQWSAIASMSATP